MAGIGNISQIEMSFMNSMIAFSRAYQNNSKLIEIRPFQEVETSKKYPEPTVFIPKSKIISIEKFVDNRGDFYYILRTEYEIFCLDEKQGDKLIKEW